MEITDDKSALKANLNELQTRFLLIRKQIENSGITEELIKQHSDVCFLLNNAIAAVQQNNRRKTMNKSLLDYTTEHMVKTTYAINDLLSHFSGTPEENEYAFAVLTQYHQAIVDHLNAAENMNFAFRTLCDMQKEEKEKNKRLPGFDSIRPTYTNKLIYGPCPCGSTNMYDPLFVFNSMPAKYELVCNKCGKTTYATVG